MQKGILAALCGAGLLFVGALGMAQGQTQTFPAKPLRILLRLPEVRQRLAPLGTEPAVSTPEAFDKLIADEVAGFTRIARGANIKVE